MVRSLPPGQVTNLVAQSQSGLTRLQFSGAINASYTILATTNLTLLPAGWSALGQASPLSGGLFQFLDSQTPIYPQRFYRIRSP